MKRRSQRKRKYLTKKTTYFISHQLRMEKYSIQIKNTLKANKKKARTYFFISFVEKDIDFPK